MRATCWHCQNFFHWHELMNDLLAGFFLNLNKFHRVLFEGLLLKLVLWSVMRFMNNE